MIIMKYIPQSEETVTLSEKKVTHIDRGQNEFITLYTGDINDEDYHYVILSKEDAEMIARALIAPVGVCVD